MKNRRPILLWLLALAIAGATLLTLCAYDLVIRGDDDGYAILAVPGEGGLLPMAEYLMRRARLHEPTGIERAAPPLPPLPFRLTGAERPVIVGHRGIASVITENTLESLWWAREYGADGVEFDIQLTRDNVLIAFHDDDLFRLAGDPRKIKDMTWDEVAARELWPRVRVTTVESALRAVAARYRRINIDFKADLNPGLSDREKLYAIELAAILGRVNAFDTVMVSAVEEEPLAYLKSLDARIQVCWEANPAWAHSRFRARNFDAIMCHISEYNDDALRNFRTDSVPIWVWGVNREDDWRKMLDDPLVAAVLTDDPTMPRRMMAAKVAAATVREPSPRR
jgi:glycerophosphoryl diester phosphodiesterase